MYEVPYEKAHAHYKLPHAKLYKDKIFQAFDDYQRLYKPTGSVIKQIKSFTQKYHHAIGHEEKIYEYVMSKEEVKCTH